MMRAGLLVAMVMAGQVSAGPVSFASGWSEQRLQLFNSNDYSFGARLGVVSEGAVSLAWARTAPSDWGATSASWDWAVESGVVATDLSRQGGDDRNLSLYFVFLPEAVANELEGANIRRLIRNRDVRVIQYVWGGDHRRGEMLGSPYAPGQGVTVVLRPAGTGSFGERVDLAADFARAFGGDQMALVGLAVSADSDDTDGVIRGSLGGLRLD